MSQLSALQNGTPTIFSTGSTGDSAAAAVAVFSAVPPQATRKKEKPAHAGPAIWADDTPACASQVSSAQSGDARKAERPVLALPAVSLDVLAPQAYTEQLTQVGSAQNPLQIGLATIMQACMRQQISGQFGNAIDGDADAAALLDDSRSPQQRMDQSSAALQQALDDYDDVSGGIGAESALRQATSSPSSAGDLADPAVARKADAKFDGAIKMDTLMVLLQSLVRMQWDLAAYAREAAAANGNILYATSRSKADSLVSEARTRLYGAIAGFVASGVVSGIGVKMSLGAQKSMRKNVVEGARRANELKAERRNLVADSKKRELPPATQEEMNARLSIPMRRAEHDRSRELNGARMRALDRQIDEVETDNMYERSFVDQKQTAAQAISGMAYSVSPIANASAEIAAATERQLQTHADAATQLAQSSLQDLNGLASKAIDSSNQLMQTLKAIWDAQLSVMNAVSRSA